MNPISSPEQAPAEVVCPHCGTINSAHSRLCVSCGMLLAQPTVKVYDAAARASEPDLPPGSLATSSERERAGSHTQDGVPAEVASLVSSQVTAVEARLTERIG